MWKFWLYYKPELAQMLKWNFCPEGFIPSFRFNHNANRKGIMLFVRKYTPSSLRAVVKSPLECFCVELDLCRIKWVISCSYSLYNAKEQISKRVFQENKARKDGVIGITEHPKKSFLNIKNLQNLFNLTKQYNCKKHNQKVYHVEYYVEHLIVFLS